MAWTRDQKIFGGIAALGAGLYGGNTANDGMDANIGFQGEIPDYDFVREAVPDNQIAGRRPGSGGQRYFSDYSYVPRGAGITTDDVTAPGQPEADVRQKAFEQAEDLRMDNYIRAGGAGTTDDAYGSPQFDYNEDTDRWEGSGTAKQNDYYGTLNSQLDKFKNTQRQTGPSGIPSLMSGGLDYSSRDSTFQPETLEFDPNNPNPQFFQNGIVYIPDLTGAGGEGQWVNLRDNAGIMDLITQSGVLDNFGGSTGDPTGGTGDPPANPYILNPGTGQAFTAEGKLVYDNVYGGDRNKWDLNKDNEVNPMEWAKMQLDRPSKDYMGVEGTPKRWQATYYDAIVQGMQHEDITPDMRTKLQELLDRHWESYPGDAWNDPSLGASERLNAYVSHAPIGSYIEHPEQPNRWLYRGSDGVVWSVLADPATGVTDPEAEAKRRAGLKAGGLASLGYAQGGAVGRYLGGPTDGMADKLPANIDGQQDAALSDGEFVIPADVVSHFGNGNSEAGADVLYNMMANVRQARTGNPEQGQQINPNQFLPQIGGR